MNKKIKIYKDLIITLIFLMFLHPSSIFNQQNIKNGTLIFYASNFENEDGQALIYLYRMEDDMPKKPYKQMTAKIVNNKATIIFNDIPYGDYAAILVQDKNSNNVIDHSWGFPSEPLGFTNNWKFSLFSGMPNFKKLIFIFSKNKSNQYIKIQD